ncbi:hypothetical protein BHE74_00024979 [Ensete ventricosum]|nr:hypothetical protein GW17_00004038 [Ensete ventricosum]RWW67564.1 hypothetical protein BHE74_00024979 [Ensete ventricosum]
MVCYSESIYTCEAKKKPYQGFQWMRHLRLTYGYRSTRVVIFVVPRCLMDVAPSVDLYCSTRVVIFVDSQDLVQRDR